MFTAADFHNLASGRKRGVVAGLLRALLWVGQGPYALVVGYRNRQFDRGGEAVVRVGAPVVSVGALTLGGAGKTPMVKWVARAFRRRGLRVALVSRGYGAEAGALNDEALELETELPDVPHVQDPDRVAAARLAIEEFESQAIVMDDGFQHRRLGRDLDIVLIDATEPWGYGALVPRGALREPVAGLARADVVCLTRRGLVDAERRRAIRDRVQQLAPRALWCEADHTPVRLQNSAGQTLPLTSLRGQRVAGLCGIGNPEAFRSTLQSLECVLAWWRAWPDHHRYTAEDIAAIETGAQNTMCPWVICTHKDLVKIGETQLGAAAVWAVVVEMALVEGEAELRGALEKVAPLQDSEEGS